ncbi:hypothetical protein F2P81_013828 [Scophthalmus maximus]|uniref:Protein kish-A n=1 Tax=Scophthalmus maximus TaxID=52904 RepID=A0A6A4SUH9_SCOMX|nr:hypothetical protein F2P81_013828 [Scophthalmus maximus]
MKIQQQRQDLSTVEKVMKSAQNQQKGSQCQQYQSQSNLVFYVSRREDFRLLLSPIQDEKDNTLSAIFNFQSLLTVILLLICTCAYIRALAPSLLDKNKTGLLGIFWKCARIGERKSPWVACCCVIMAFSILFQQ